MNKLWKCYAQCVKGKRHQEKNMLCQDRVAYQQKGNRQAIVLIDGIGSTDRNIIAGERVAEYIAGFFLDQFEEIMTGNEAEIKFQLMRQVRRIIEALTIEYKCSEQEFGSTVMAVCICHDSKQYCGIHLGDGIITYKDSVLHVMSYPLNGLDAKQTCLTISETAMNKMKLFRGNIGDTTQYILMSDGMYSYPVHRQELERIIDSMKGEGMIAAKEDDRSIIGLACEENSV